jgi:hypothetical protein
MDDKEKPKAPPEDEPKFEVAHRLAHRLEPMYLDEMGALVKARGWKLRRILDRDGVQVYPEQ